MSKLSKKIHQLLKLHHHKHTGKLLHHRHTSYRALLLIMAISGVFMLATSQLVRAGDYIVTATVPAPIPSGAPIITSPPDGTTITTPNVTIEGTCPIILPAIIITLHDGSTLLGSGQCTPVGTFSVPVSLQERTYSIVATVVTITGDNGESSLPHTLTYKAPTSSSSTNPSKSTSTSSNSGKPRETTTASAGLEILSDKPFVVYGSVSDAVWSGYFKGGTTPYVITISWGDGSTQTYKNVGRDRQIYSHRYNRLKAYQITVTVKDAADRSISQTFAAATPIIFDNGSAGAGITQTMGGLHISTTILLYAFYFALLGLLFVLW